MRAQLRRETLGSVKFKRTQSRRGIVLRHDNKLGRKRLLIVTAALRDRPLDDYSTSLLENALSKIVPILGAWATITVTGVYGSKLDEVVERYDPDHVLLMGQRFFEPMRSQWPVAKSTTLYGLLLNRGGRRWIITPSLTLYGLDDAHWTTASLMGHLFRHLEILRTGILGWDNPNGSTKHRMVKDRASWLELRALLDKKKLVAIDTETSRLRRIGGTILTIQFGFDGITGWVLPVQHPETPLPKDVLDEALKYLKHYFESGRPCVHIYANAGFDLHQFKTLLDIRWYAHRVWDVPTAWFNLDETYESRKMLGFIKGEIWSLERLAIEGGMFHYNQESPIKKSDRANLINKPLADVAKYGAIDVVLPIRLFYQHRAIARWRSSHMDGDPYKNYFKVLTEVESAKILQFVWMERNGLFVDRKYLVSLLGPRSPLHEEIVAAEKDFYAHQDVKRASEIILKRGNVRAGSLFGGKSASSVNVFDHGKPEHQQLLFFDVCKLKKLKELKNGGGAVDKEFKAKYAKHSVVKLFTDIETSKKLTSTVAGYYKILCKSPDNKDGALHTRFGHLNVRTGRTSSSEPNLQNAPVRNKSSAKKIKRIFIAKRGTLIVKDDASAHEVRVTGLTAGDPSIAKSFWNGMQVRLKYELQRHIPDDKKDWWNKQLIAADVHYQNYARFYNVSPLEVTKDQRDGVKSTIFGVTYGYAIKTLGRVLITNGVMRIQSKIDEIKKVEASDNKVTPDQRRSNRRKMNELQDEIDEIRGKDQEQVGQEMYDLIFKKNFAVAGKWLEDSQKFSQVHLVASNMLGGVRHLWGHLHTERRVTSAMDRRTPNSIIQGTSSNLVLRGGYETRRMIWEFFESRGIDLGYKQCNMIHDSQEALVDIVNIPLIRYLRHHASSTILHRWVQGTFGKRLLVGLESDAEIGGSMVDMRKSVRWDEQVDAIRNGIEWGNKELGWGLPVEAYMKRVVHNAKIIHDIRRREIKRQLQHNVPTNTYMEMNRDNALSYGLVFSPPKTAVVSQAKITAKTRLLEELQ